MIRLEDQGVVELLVALESCGGVVVVGSERTIAALKPRLPLHLRILRRQSLLPLAVDLDSLSLAENHMLHRIPS